MSHVRAFHFEFLQGIDIGLNHGAPGLHLRDERPVERPSGRVLRSAVDVHRNHRRPDGTAARTGPLSARVIGSARSETG